MRNVSFLAFLSLAAAALAADCPAPAECPHVYNPVCGSDGDSYSNACELQQEACKNPSLNLVKAKDGACKECPQADCFFGTDYNKTVCSTTDKFAGMCVFNDVLCRKPSKAGSLKPCDAATCDAIECKEDGTECLVGDKYLTPCAFYKARCADPALKMGPCRQGPVVDPTSLFQTSEASTATETAVVSSAVGTFTSVVVPTTTAAVTDAYASTAVSSVVKPTSPVSIVNGAERLVGGAAAVAAGVVGLFVL
ncbi:hypothetical protein HDU97_004441 [Phlyctochytrium planicorne]|nr:hypothetical protein HDU97_004441 [Phlyctochytrium planicorne]